MIELIRQSAVPANVMRSAAKGALALPPAEMIEILVYLASTPLFGDEARLTLAGWDETACREVCGNPESPKEVIDYFLHNRRPRLMPTLLDNTAVGEMALLEMAQEHSTESVQLLLATTRAKTSRTVLQALSSNPALLPSQAQQVKTALEHLPPESAPETDELPDVEQVVAQYVNEHAHEIAADEGKEFQLIGEDESEAQAEVAAALAPEAPVAAPLATAAAPKAAIEHERVSPLQKIARMSVSERVQLAIKGNREERYILIRDASKVVSSAVLESPKVTEQEVEVFAAMKNVQETVLRGIAAKRKYKKIYSVIRTLSNNPRCPLDVQLPLVKNLLNMDLKALSMNKNVNDTIRKVALKLFRDRTEKKNS